jgi:hypothetical protein
LLDGDTSVSSQMKGTDTPIGTEIELRDLGVDGDTTSPWVGIRWRFAERWRLDFNYFRSRQDGSGIAEAEINFGDVTIPAGIAAKASFDADSYALGVGWSFPRNEKAELDIGLGLHVANLSVAIAGTGFVGDIEAPVLRNAATTTAPLPDARLYGGYALAPTLALEGGIGWFSLNYGDFDGDLRTATAVLEWRPTQRYGVGVGYTYLDFDLTVDESRTRDSYDFRLDGPILYLSAGF